MEKTVGLLASFLDWRSVVHRLREKQRLRQAALGALLDGDLTSFRVAVKIGAMDQSGEIFLLLRRLERDGFVSAFWSDAPIPGCRLYHIEEKGRLIATAIL